MNRPLPTLSGDLKRWALIQANSLLFLRSLPDACVDAVVTDPPYGLGFNGEPWDGGGLLDPLGFQSFSRDWAIEARRVLKPGGHLVAFGSPRTYHRLVAGCEDAGLEIRDLLLWLHGAGVPKSRRIAGTATTLKPTYEPILLARTPLGGRTVKRALDEFGTGSLNIDACRIPRGELASTDPALDYWPSDLVLSHQPGCKRGACLPGCVVPAMDEVGVSSREPVSRLFYAAKAARLEREAGLGGLPTQRESFFAGAALKHPRANVHPTVKPLDLMRWLIRLCAPPGGLVLDPFTGSGSTGCAAVLEQRQFVGIERERRFVRIAEARLGHWSDAAGNSDRPGS